MCVQTHFILINDTAIRKKQKGVGTYLLLWRQLSLITAASCR